MPCNIINLFEVCLSFFVSIATMVTADTQFLRFRRVYTELVKSGAELDIFIKVSYASYEN